MRDDEEVNLEEVRYTAEDIFPDYIEKETPIDDDLQNKVQPQNTQGWEVTLDVLLDP